MKYTIEFTLLPQEDVTLYFIWQKLYQQIHLALTENKNKKNASKIGVSFPEYHAESYCLGKKMRLFAEDKQSLKDMQCEKWLTRLRDYVNWKPIAPVPEKIAGHACFRHIKMKGNKEKLSRRRAKRHGETLQQALAHFSGYEEERSKLPYINMVSLTNGRHFRLFVEKQEKDQPQTGYYSCYGLSSTTTVPLF